MGLANVSYHTALSVVEVNEKPLGIAHAFAPQENQAIIKPPSCLLLLAEAQALLAANMFHTYKVSLYATRRTCEDRMETSGPVLATPLAMDLVPLP